jgi:hypothetical protein
LGMLFQFMKDFFLHILKTHRIHNRKTNNKNICLWINKLSGSVGVFGDYFLL